MIRSILGQLGVACEGTALLEVRRFSGVFIEIRRQTLAFNKFMLTAGKQLALFVNVRETKKYHKDLIRFGIQLKYSFLGFVQGKENNNGLRTVENSLMTNCLKFKRISGGKQCLYMSNLFINLTSPSLPRGMPNCERKERIEIGMDFGDLLGRQIYYIYISHIEYQS